MPLMKCSSYESLPPNYSIGANMMAGAFAGIAVSLLHSLERLWELIQRKEHSVMYPFDLLKV